MHYYPYGKTLRSWETPSPFPQKYLTTHNERDLETGYDHREARNSLAEIGSRFLTIDPLADEAPGWTPYRYGFNNPILYIDSDGLFEDKAAAEAYAKENGIKMGWFRNNKIVKQNDGTYAIENQKAHTSIANDSEFGIMTSALVTADSPDKSVSGQIMSGTLVVAAITSQIDSPILGPADAVGVVEILLGSLVAGLAYVTVDQLRTTTTIADPAIVYSINKEDNMKGGKQSSRDKDYGINDKNFWRWWHRKGKPSSGGQDIGSKSDADKIFKDWVSKGKPKAK